MKRTIKTIILFVMAFFPVIANAYDAYIDGIYYDFDNNNRTASVTFQNYFVNNENAYSGNVVIPENVNYNGLSYRVTKIGYDAMANCSGVTSVRIPNSVTVIEHDAFKYCSNLPSVILPCNITSIEHGTFQYCQNLKSIVIPDDVKTIHDQAFQYCRSLKIVTIGKAVEKIEFEAFRSCESLSSVYCRATQVPSMERDVFAQSNVGNATLYVLSNDVGSYENAEQWNLFGSIQAYYGVVYDAYIDGIYYVFDNTSKTATVTHQAYYYHNEYAYSGDVTIPESVDYNGISYLVNKIGCDAMAHCNGVTSISIPNGVTEIEHDAFKNCENLPSLSLPINITSIEHGTCQHCQSLTDFVVPDNVTVIHDQAFQYCRSLNTLTIGKNVEKIEYEAFRGCELLTTVFSYANQVPSLERDVFNGINLSNATLYVPYALLNSYQASEQWNQFGTITAFDNPEPIEVTIDGINYIADTMTKTAKVVRGNYSGSVEISSSITVNGVRCDVTRIEEAAFNYCWDVTSLSIPESVVSIGRDALIGTQWYENQPNGVVYAGTVAYNYKGYMQPYSKLALKRGTKGIGDYAFSCCDGLISILIPESMENIGEGAFEYCHSLTSLDIPIGVKNIGNGAFRNCCELTSMIIPDNVPTIGNNAFQNCYGLNSVVIGKNVSKIGEQAFDNCNGLTNITLPAKIAMIGSGAFYQCRSLSDVYCLSEDVPITANNAFSNEYIRNATLHVPASSIEDYSYEEPWINFGKIVALTDEESAIFPLKANEQFSNLQYYTIDGRRTNLKKGLSVVFDGKKWSKKINVR
jgi:hypothetical protein